LDTGKQIYVRDRLKENGEQHFGRGLLIQVLNDTTLEIKPQRHGGKTEKRDIDSIHLWKDRTVQNPSGGLSEEELEEALQEGKKKMYIVADEAELAKTVLMDPGYLRFTSGKPGLTSFTESISEAFVYKSDKTAGRSQRMIHKNPKLHHLVSQAGLVILTKKEALQVIKCVRKLQGDGYMPELTTLAKVEAPNPNVILGAINERIVPRQVDMNAPPPATRSKGSNLNGEPHLNGHASNDQTPENQGGTAELQEARRILFANGPHLTGVSEGSLEAKLAKALQDFDDAFEMLSEAKQQITNTAREIALSASVKDETFLAAIVDRVTTSIRQDEKPIPASDNKPEELVGQHQG
jgi:hypothetical protein